MHGLSNPVYLILAAGLFALLPLIAGLFTSYLKMSIIFGMMRSGLGAQQVPGPLVVMAMSVSLTALTMGPVFDETAGRLKTLDFQHVVAKPTLDGLKKLSSAFEPWLEFLIRHCGERELRTFSTVSYVDNQSENTPQSLKPPLRAVLAAFIFTEIKESFAMAFVLLLPFLVIDLIVANILAGMGMFMVSPAIISLPLKLMLFVTADGWLLLAKSLVSSYAVAP